VALGPVLTLFKRCENHWRGDDAYHGSGGELRVEEQCPRWDILDRFTDAAEQAGIPRADRDLQEGPCR
jgi:choline dehydrogenase